jgi:hypothetical protein
VWKKSCFVPLRARVKKCSLGGNHWSGDVWKESCFVPLRARVDKCGLGGNHWSADVWKESSFRPLTARVKKCGLGGNHWSAEVWKESCFVKLRARLEKCSLRRKYWFVPGNEVSPSFHIERVCEASMILKASLFLKLNSLEGEISKFLPNMCILLQNSTVSQYTR